MEIIIFTVIAIALYLISSQLLVLLERFYGKPLPQRNIIFFLIIMALSLPSFSLMRNLLGEEGSQHDDQEQQAPDGGDQAPQTH